ncbi:MAG TPA: hypothetical protein VGA50_07925 [Kiloniellales bacterium]
MAALMLSGCVAAGIATVAAGGGLGYAFSKEKPETTASAAPAGGSDVTLEPAAAGEPDYWGRPAAPSEPSNWSQPTVLVEPQAPVEEVEIQPLQ